MLNPTFWFFNKYACKQKVIYLVYITQNYVNEIPFFFICSFKNILTEITSSETLTFKIFFSLLTFENTYKK